MKEMAWAIMFSIPWPNQAIDKLVIYTFPSRQECVQSIPGVKRKHRLFFQDVRCIVMGPDEPPRAEHSKPDENQKNPDVPGLS